MLVLTLRLPLTPLLLMLLLLNIFEHFCRVRLYHHHLRVQSVRCRRCWPSCVQSLPATLSAFDIYTAVFAFTSALLL